MNMACGGAFFPDSCPNANGQPLNGKKPYWDGRDKWLPTWQQNEDAPECTSMIVDYIKCTAI